MNDLRWAEKMEQRKKRLIKLYIWLTLGILISIMAGMMKTSGSVNLGEFFQQGSVYEFSPETLVSSSGTCYYDADIDAYVLLSRKAQKTLPLMAVDQSWSFISLSVDSLNQESANLFFVFYDADNNRLGRQLNTIVNGDNLIPIEYPEKFQRIKLVMNNQQGLTLRIQSMQLKESDVGFSNDIFFKTCCVAMAGYLLVSILFLLWKRLNWYTLIEILQYAYILFGDYLGSRLFYKLQKKTRDRIRTGMFCLLFFFNMIFQAFQLYLKSDFYKYGILVNVILLILVGLFCWEKPLSYLKWKGILPVTWFLLWTGVCISDLVVSKYFKFVGYAFLFGVGFFFFVWNQMERPKQIRNDMIRGLEWTFPIALVYCMIFRKRIDGIYYNGCYSNHRDMAMYALMMWIVFLSEIIYYLIYSRARQKGRWLVLYFCGAGLSAYLLWQTHVRTALAAGTVALALFFCTLFKRKWKCEKKVLVLASGCCVIAVFSFHFSTAKLPDALHSNLVWHQDCFEISDGVVDEEVWNAKADQNVVEKLKPVTEVHKKAIWKSYLRKLNLFGNEDRLIVYEKKTMAYNGGIEMAYRYGMFILIPYVGLLLLCLYRAVQEGGYLMLATTLSFGIVLLMQNIEQPFAHPLWIVFYLGMGIWFTDSSIRKNKRVIGKRIYRLTKEEKKENEEANS